MERIVQNISKMSGAGDDSNQDRRTEQGGATKKPTLMNRLMGLKADSEEQIVRDLDEEQ